MRVPEEDPETLEDPETDPVGLTVTDSLGEVEELTESVPEMDALDDPETDPVTLKDPEFDTDPVELTEEDPVID